MVSKNCLSISKILRALLSSSSLSFLLLVLLHNFLLFQIDCLEQNETKLEQQQYSSDPSWNFTQWWDERAENTQLYSEPVMFEEPKNQSQSSISATSIPQYGDFERFGEVHYKPGCPHDHLPDDRFNVRRPSGDGVMVTSTMIKVDQKYIPQTSIDILNYTIRYFFSKPRHWSEDKNYMRDLREAIKEKFLSFGLKTAFHVFKTEYNNEKLQSLYPDKKRQTATNIIAILPGKYRGTPKDEIYLIGAHYDTVQKSPGIDDNGSGAAAVIEIARLFTKHKCYFNKTIIFTLFDLEEEV
ncbi:M28 Zn-Peptidase-like protein [Sarcoptes scabiei]|uniref:M28 Zn-Peptidase-like protein n=1 Tax=Sarcoptes scabiei TaxID=52283 RepID=A0A132AD81_SARSC|nr:M28 Zn-Peptidase-like protein [Sarcoptes scabiei]